MSFNIFTDGGCIGNPGPGGWAAIVVDGNRYEELGGANISTTNNRMEMTAAIEGLRKISDGEHVTVTTDSKYLIDGITKWIHGWKKRGWRKSDGDEVLNRDLWVELGELVASRKVHWSHIKGHSGHPENERCDYIANTFARGKVPELRSGDGSWIFSGGVEKDEVYVKPLYLSSVNGSIDEHDTWAECEVRIKGVRGAKCKKVKTRKEHIETIAAWGEE